MSFALGVGLPDEHSTQPHASRRIGALRTDTAIAPFRFSARTQRLSRNHCHLGRGKTGETVVSRPLLTQARLVGGLALPTASPSAAAGASVMPLGRDAERSHKDVRDLDTHASFRAWACPDPATRRGRCRFIHSAKGARPLPGVSGKYGSSSTVCGR